MNWRVQPVSYGFTILETRIRYKIRWALFLENLSSRNSAVGGVHNLLGTIPAMAPSFSIPTSVLCPIFGCLPWQRSFLWFLCIFVPSLLSHVAVPPPAQPWCVPSDDHAAWTHQDIIFSQKRANQLQCGSLSVS